MLLALRARQRYTVRMTCRLCGSPTDALGPSAPLSRYESCSECGYLQLAQSHLPTGDDERKRYLLHRNDPADPGYRSWLTGFVDELIMPALAPGARVLDYGCGPEPALSALLTERDFNVSSWDPFFHPDCAWTDATWDAIVLHEVAEHMHWPGDALRLAASRLAPGGFLFIRTGRPPADARAFSAWWYRQDISHVGFFSLRCQESFLGSLGLRLWLDNGKDGACFRAGDRKEQEN